MKGVIAIRKKLIRQKIDYNEMLQQLILLILYAIITKKILKQIFNWEL